jgi:hypothetical protein
MNESGGQETKQGLSASSNGAVMTKEEKFAYLGVIILATLMATFTLGMALFAAFSFHKMVRQENMNSVHQLSIVLFVISAAFLCLLIWIGFIIIRRRMKTGSYLPTGERLVKWRERQSRPEPLWKRITFAFIYLIFVIDITFCYLTKGLHSGFLRPATIFFWYIVLFYLWITAAVFIMRIFVSIISKKVQSRVPEELQPPPESERK